MTTYLEITAPSQFVAEIVEGTTPTLELTVNTPSTITLELGTGIIENSDKLIAPVPEYDAQGRLIRITGEGGYAKQFGYNTEGLLATNDFIRPGQSTLRKNIYWSNGRWNGTSAPEVI